MRNQEVQSVTRECTWCSCRYVASWLAAACVFLFFFFQAEDGIRDVAVTGVQTCALPISVPGGGRRRDDRRPGARSRGRSEGAAGGRARGGASPQDRSEERRVGKEGRSRWSPYH